MKPPTALRLERGLTQRELTRAADINVTWLSHIEAGRPNPAWGAALDVPVSELALRAERLAAGHT